jgi:CYTH domain-containing protein
MQIFRQFLIAPSLARLIQREAGIARQVTDGYFSDHPERQHLVRLKARQCHLIVVGANSAVEPNEDPAEIPRQHAEALLDLCSGRISYEQIILHIQADQEVLLDRIVAPGSLDLAVVMFSDRSQADAFEPPIWLGAEVTGDTAYTRRAIALKGLPPAIEVPLSGAQLDALLDVLAPDEIGNPGAARGPDDWAPSARRSRRTDPLDEETDTSSNYDPVTALARSLEASGLLQAEDRDTAASGGEGQLEQSEEHLARSPRNI